MVITFEGLSLVDRILMTLLIVPRIGEEAALVKVGGKVVNGAEAITKIKEYIKTKIDSLFEYVKETFDLGDKIRFKTVDGAEVTISKNEFTNAEADYCINGCFTGDTLIN